MFASSSEWIYERENTNEQFVDKINFQHDLLMAYIQHLQEI